MDSVLKKQAAEALRGLQDENTQLRTKLAHLESVQGLLFKLYKAGSISAENLESYYKDLLDKTDEDITVLDKVAELHSSETLLFGSLSEKPQDDGSMDNLTRFLLEDL